jgi:antitoxin CcdA
MTAKKAVNVSIDQTLLAKAKAEGLNLSAELEQTVRTRVSSIEAENWKRENAEALAANAACIDVNGLPLAGLRQF